MREVTLPIYTFAELPKNIQEKLVDKYIDVEMSMYEFDSSEVVSLLNEIGFEDAKIWYSLGGCQGDGVCFDAICNAEKLLKVIGCEGRNVHIWIMRCGPWNHYSHKETRCITVDSQTEPYEIAENIEQRLEDLRLEQCLKIEQLIREDMNHYSDRERARDALSSFEYFADGRKYDS